MREVPAHVELTRAEWWEIERKLDRLDFVEGLLKQYEEMAMNAGSSSAAWVQAILDGKIQVVDQ